MEPMGAISEGEWSSFSGVYSSEEADFMAMFMGNCSFPKEIPGVSFRIPSTYWPDHESTMSIAAVDQCSLYSSDSTNINMHCFSQGSSHSGGSNIIFPTPSHESYYPSDSNQILLTTTSSMSTDYCMEGGKNTSSPVPVFTDNLIEGDDFLNHDVSSGIMEECGGNLTEAVLQGNNLQLGREPEMPMPEPSTDNKVNNLLENPNDRSSSPGDVQKNKRNVKSRKNEKLVPSSNNDEDTNAVLHRQSSTSRGSATDPQSLYARRRREKINERLRILQTLVPNGTKVDISTMLEEAVQYVKFLQLQIKLLSSDDLWMYAPLAYNGMDIGLDLKITTPR